MNFRAAMDCLSVAKQRRERIMNPRGWRYNRRQQVISKQK